MKRSAPPESSEVAGAPSGWLVVEAAKPSDELASGILIEILSSLSGRGVEERATTLVAYFEAQEHVADQVLHSLRERISEARIGFEPELFTSWQDHEDWIEHWRTGIHPRRVGQRLVVSPTWESPSLRSGDILILLDPGIAFGTAEHPTTRGCLRLLDRFVSKEERIADVGSGSGILSIAAALLGASEVVAVDADPWACAATRENADLNGVGDRIQVLEEQVDARFLPDIEPFDGIVANIEGEVLIPWLEGFRRGLQPRGWMVLGGILAKECGELADAAANAGFQLAAEDVEGPWWTAGFIAPSPNA